MVRVPTSSEVCTTRQRSYDATISAVRQLSDSTIACRSRVKPERLAFLPGQYVNLGMPGSEQTRSYSFSSPPSGWRGQLPDPQRAGRPDEQLPAPAGQRPGDSMTFSRAVAAASTCATSARPVLMLAGGTGLAPFPVDAGQNRRAGQRPSDPPGLRRHATTSTWWKDRLEAFAARIPNFTFSACVADPDSQHPLKGYVTHHLEAKHLNDGDVDVYLCGPPPMVEAVQQVHVRRSRRHPGELPLREVLAGQARR